MKKLFILFFQFYLFYININFIKSNFQIQDNNRTKFNSDNSSNFFKNFFKKNAVISIIQGYSLSIILPFFESLIHSNFKNCDIVVFVKDVSQLIFDYLKNIRVIIHDIPKEYNNFSMTNLRWKLYKDFLETKKNDYNMVLFADIKKK